MNAKPTEYFMVFDKDKSPPRAMFLDQKEARDYMEKNCQNADIERFALELVDL